MADTPNPEPVRVEVSMETRLSPAGVIDSLVDFSPRRLEIWSTIDPTKYQVHEMGNGWADVTEGSADPNIYARERYEWTDTLVTAVTIESDFCLPGDTTEYRVRPSPGGGSVVDIIWGHRQAAPEYEPIYALMRDAGAAVLRTHYGGTWDRLAEGA